jgi:hypothetical protein
MQVELKDLSSQGAAQVLLAFPSLQHVVVAVSAQPGNVLSVLSLGGNQRPPTSYGLHKLPGCHCVHGLGQRGMLAVQISFFVAAVLHSCSLRGSVNGSGCDAAIALSLCSCSCWQGVWLPGLALLVRQAGGALLSQPAL